MKQRHIQTDACAALAEVTGTDGNGRLTVGPGNGIEHYSPRLVEQ
jgi:hypothetical protein